MTSLPLSYFDFDLPDELIAQAPAPARGQSRLLVLDAPGASGASDAPATTNAISDRHIADLPSLLAPGDLLVMNDTRVINARLHGTKASGGRIELLVERVIDAHRVIAQVRASHAPRPGSIIEVAGARGRIVGRHDRFHEIEFDSDISALLERHGEMPLPPYIRRTAGQDDAERYQTVYAREPGAVAAPTAGLHFTPEILAALTTRGIDHAFLTLHVGAGTFLPVQADDIAEHRMHSERFVIPEATVRKIEHTRAAGGRIVAVGTTSMRALEAAADVHGRVRPGPAETDIFITPGYAFRVIDRLLTNFHLPRSTLLMLVSAFSGPERIRTAYAHAIASRYRFFSYGDAMLLTRSSNP